MKSYFAASIQGAIKEAKRELGPDAILVTSRIAPADGNATSSYEVVFATDAPEPKPSATQTDPVQPVVRQEAPLEGIRNEIKDLRRQIEALRHSHSPAAVRGATQNGAAQELLSLLVAAEVDADFAQQLIAGAVKRSAASGRETGRFAEILRNASGAVSEAPSLAALIEEIRSNFLVDNTLAKSSSGAVAALIGPPGAGKTVTLAKLAITCGLKLRVPTLLVSLASSRVAASEQLRAYSQVLGFRFELAQTVRALGQIVEENTGKGLILVDTPGFSAHELDADNEVAKFFAEKPDVQKHLVLPASARPHDIGRTCSAYEVFRPTHLIFSRTDEASMFGSVLNEVMASRRPVSFFSTGQRVPDDLVAATADFLVEQLSLSQDLLGMAVAA